MLYYYRYMSIYAHTHIQLIINVIIICFTIHVEWIIHGPLIRTTFAILAAGQCILVGSLESQNLSLPFKNINVHC